MLPGNDSLRLGIVHHGDFYDIALCRNFPGRRGDSGTECSDLFASLFAQIVNRQLEAGPGDVRGHGSGFR